MITTKATTLPAQSTDPLAISGAVSALAGTALADLQSLSGATGATGPTHFVRGATAGTLSAYTYDPVAQTLTKSTAGAFNSEANIDGITYAVGDRILVKDESNSKGGIYVVTTQAGTWVLTRASDWSASSDVRTGAQIAVAEGTVNTLTNWQVTNTGAFVLDTTTPTFARATTATGLVHATVDIPLATIQAQASGVAFNVGAALPANARLLAGEIKVIQALAGGTISAGHATLQNTGEAAGALLASTDVYSATGTFSLPGSNPTASRGGQQLQMTLTAVGDTLAHATGGHLEVDLFYIVLA